MLKESLEIVKKYFFLIKENRKILIPYYIGYFMNIIVELVIPIIVANITENITKSLYIYTFIMIAYLLLFKLLNSFLSYLDMHSYSKFFHANYITLFKKLINKIYIFDENYKKKFSSGRIISSLTTDVINIGEMADNILSIILNLLKILIVFIYLIKVNTFLAIYIICVDFIYIFLANKLTELSTKYLMMQRVSNDSLIGLLNQTINGLKDIKTMNLSQNLNKKFNKIYGEWGKAYDIKRKYQILRKTGLNSFITINLVIVYLVSVLLIINNNMNLGIMLIIVSYFNSLFSSSETIMSAFSSIKEQNISLLRISELLEYLESINVGKKKIKNIEGIIEFKNVDFSYDEKRFVKNVNLKIKNNAITAIVGKNGAGKTTLLNLITRLYKPDKGVIFLDNDDIHSIDRDSYLKSFSILNQETYLFNLSIRENFNLINKDRKRQEEICKFVGIDKFINSLPNKYDTVISENSSNISGGQKRLLSLARTLLRESKVLILDEVTSSLDLNITNKIVDILKKLKEDHTIIVVTHRKEMMKLADEIILVNKGKIDSIGNHYQLIRKSKLYKIVYKSN